MRELYVDRYSESPIPDDYMIDSVARTFHRKIKSDRLVFMGKVPRESTYMPTKVAYHHEWLMEVN